MTPNDTAKQLLVKHLTLKQMEEFTKNKFKSFSVNGNHGGHYLIYTFSFINNIRDLDSEDFLCCYCDCVKEKRIPTPDHWLAQKLYIETNENHFLKRSNRTKINDITRLQLYLHNNREVLI